MVDLAYRILNKVRGVFGLGSSTFIFDELALPNAAKTELLATSKTDLAKIFYQHQGRMVTKWTHYLDLYDRHLSQFRGKPVRMLEIGVFKGGSLELWRKYFGPELIMYGIDITPECADRVDAPNQVRIGSQADPEFLKQVVAEMGGVDIVLDDGSHIAEHQRASFKSLFPLLSNNGFYIIEDMHTAYWPGQFHGGLRRKGSAVEIVKEMIDDMHRTFHRQPRPPHGSFGGIHVYDSITFIEKSEPMTPRHIKIGAEAS